MILCKLFGTSQNIRNFFKTRKEPLNCIIFIHILSKLHRCVLDLKNFVFLAMLTSFLVRAFSFFFFTSLTEIPCRVVVFSVKSIITQIHLVTVLCVGNCDVHHYLNRSYLFLFDVGMTLLNCMKPRSCFRKLLCCHYGCQISLKELDAHGR